MAQKMRRSRQEWERIIGAQASSGLSARKYCEQKSIGLASFYQWRQRLLVEEPSVRKKDGTQTSFIDMGPFGSDSAETSVAGTGYELTLELGGGMRIVIRRG